MRPALVAVLLFLTACASAPEVGSESVAGSATRPLTLTRPSDTPEVDRSKASVDLGEIIFDTFGRGPRFTLETGRNDVIENLLDAIVPIDGPSYQPASAQTWLQDDDLVIGYLDPTGFAWAYPVRMLNKHEIVNDELGGQKVLISYCPLCGSGVVYDRIVSGRELSFSNTSALYENDMVMVDRETGTYWWQVAGSAIVGEQTGAELTPLPARTTTWARWTEEFPETAVMERLPRRGYGEAFANYPEQLDMKRTPFPVSSSVLDDPRLTPGTKVVAVTVDGQTVAWPVAPARTVSTTIGDENVRAELDGTGGVVFSASGEALPTRTAFWFSVLSSFPDVRVATE